MSSRKKILLAISILSAIAIWPIAVLIVVTIMVNIIPAIITIGLIGIMAYSIYKGMEDEEPYI